MSATRHIHGMLGALFQMNFQLRKKLLSNSVFFRLRNLLKSVPIPWHRKVTLYSASIRFSENIRKHEILERSNAVAYNLILAIFPAIIFLFTLIPYVSKLFSGINQESIMSFISIMMPRSMYEVLSETVLDIVSNQRGGLLTFGFVAALYLATNGMNALIHAFNACYKTTESRSAWRVRLTATSLTLILALVLILTVVMVIIGEIALDYIGANLRQFRYLEVDEFTLNLFQLMRLVIVFIGFFLAISCIYYFGPSVHYNWNFFSLGSLLATFASMAVSYGFSAYVTGVGSYNKLYGSIGVLIALMVWIQLLSLVLLAGYEVNSTLHQLSHRDEAGLKKN